MINSIFPCWPSIPGDKIELLSHFEANKSLLICMKASNKQDSNWLDPIHAAKVSYFVNSSKKNILLSLVYLCKLTIETLKAINIFLGLLLHSWPWFKIISEVLRNSFFPRIGSSLVMVTPVGPANSNYFYPKLRAIIQRKMSPMEWEVFARRNCYDWRGWRRHSGGLWSATVEEVDLNLHSNTQPESLNFSLLAVIKNCSEASRRSNEPDTLNRRNRKPVKARE